MDVVAAALAVLAILLGLAANVSILALARNPQNRSE